jgi:hypothetical protein
MFFPFISHPYTFNGNPDVKYAYFSDDGSTCFPFLLSSGSDFQSCDDTKCSYIPVLLTTSEAMPIDISSFFLLIFLRIPNWNWFNVLKTSLLQIIGLS